MSFVELVSRQKRAILTVIGILCVAGAYCAWTLPTSIFPQTDFPRIVVTIDAGEMPADQMLASITRPVEEAINGVPGVVSMRSDTSRGSAQVDVFFDWSVDIVLSLQLVEARLSSLRSTLPEDAKLQVDRLTFAVFPVLGFSLTSETRDPASLRDVAQFTFAPRLSRLPGIARVAVLGGKVHEVHVVIDPGRLAGAGLGLTEVVEAIQNSNVLESPGLVEENHQLNLVLVSGQAQKPSDLENLVVGSAEGRPILLTQVARVETGVMPEYVIVTADEKPAVLLNIFRQPDASTVAVADAVKRELTALHIDAPPDVHVAPFYDESLLVRASMASVRDAVIIGLVLSAVILFLFLHNVRTALVATAVIPVTVLITFAAMKLAGLGFDLMTLGGVAAAIGLVIDDAIVVVENIHAHLLHGENRAEAVAAAVKEITIPIVGSTMTPVVVFLPLSTLVGITGVFFRALALTMVVALLTSLALALTFTPALAEQFLKSPTRTASRKGSYQPEEERRFLRTLGAVYVLLLRGALRRRWIVFALMLGTAAVAALLYSSVGTAFLPEFDEGAFVLDYVAPPGTSLTETHRILKQVESILRETPEVESYSLRIGAQLGLDITEPNTGDFLVKLKKDRSRSTEEVTSDIRGQIEEQIPEDMLEIEFAGILNDLIGDLISTPEEIEVKLFSNDTKALLAKADEVEGMLAEVRGVVDTYNGVVVSGPAITFRIDPLRAAQLGVTTKEISETATAALTGTVASTILEQGRPIDVRVVLPSRNRSSLAELRGLLLRSASSGAQFRLEQVADVVYESGQTELHRDSLRQAVAVTARIESSKTDLGTAIREIQQRMTKIELPPGMSVEYGGLYKEQQESFLGLLVALVFAVLLVFLVLLVEFRGFAAPAAIVSGAILALPGVLIGLLLTGQTLNVVSFVGAILVVGIVAKNGILMLDTVEDHLAAGESITEALTRSGRRRLRPVLMTSFATILGMLPLSLAIGEGSQLLQPLAIAVIGGLAVALILSLLVTPVLYVTLRREPA